MTWYKWLPEVRVCQLSKQSQAIVAYVYRYVEYYSEKVIIHL